MSSSASYDRRLGDILLLQTTQMAMPVGGSALYDLIKDVLLQQGVPQRVQITQHTASDGSQLQSGATF